MNEDKGRKEVTRLILGVMTVLFCFHFSEDFIGMVALSTIVLLFTRLSTNHVNKLIN